MSPITMCTRQKGRVAKEECMLYAISQGKLILISPPLHMGKQCSQHRCRWLHAMIQAKGGQARVCGADSMSKHACKPAMSKQRQQVKAASKNSTYRLERPQAKAAPTGWKGSTHAGNMALGVQQTQIDQHSNQFRQSILPKVELQPRPVTKETGPCLVAAITTHISSG